MGEANRGGRMSMTELGSPGCVRPAAVAHNVCPALQSGSQARVSHADDLS
jgi:hypothetical protein